MDSLNPNNVADYINALIADGRFRNQAEVVSFTGISKSTLSNILSGKKKAGWTFVAKFKEGLSTGYEHKTKSYISKTEAPLLLNDATDPLRRFKPPEETRISDLERIIDSKDETIETLRKQVELLELKMGAALDQPLPKKKSEVA